MERIRNEPVVLIVAAAAAVAAGIDLSAISGAAEQLLELAVLAGGATLAREQVTPTRKL